MAQYFRKLAAKHEDLGGIAFAQVLDDALARPNAT